MTIRTRYSWRSASAVPSPGSCWTYSLAQAVLDVALDRLFYIYCFLLSRGFSSCSVGRLNIYVCLVAGKIYLNRNLPCLDMLGAEAGNLDSSALGGPCGLSKPAGLVLQRGDWRGPAELTHWKVLVQTLLSSSSFLILGAEGGGWTRVAHRA